MATLCGVGMSIGVDIGGTKILAGIVTDDGEIVSTARRPTPRNDANDVLELVAEVVNELVSGTAEPIEGVGVGVAGLVDAERARVYFAPNLRWSQVPVRALLEASPACRSSSRTTGTSRPGASTASVPVAEPRTSCW